MERYRNVSLDTFNFESDTLNPTLNHGETVYHTLHNAEPKVPISHAEREAVLEVVNEHQHRSTAISNPNSSDVNMRGMTLEDIEELQKINESVVIGKQKLLDCLKKYNDCCERHSEQEKMSHITQKSFESIYNHITSLSELYQSVKETCKTHNIIDTLKTLEDEIMSEIGCDLALTQIEKDRAESSIKYLAKTYGILKDAPLTHTCPVCITNEVDMYLEPCGHTLCHYCLQQKPTYCHMCRTKIRLAKSLYYS